MLEASKDEREKEYKKMILQKTKDVLIVKSRQPGFGKSTFILK